jgi:radical SAM protein with 4Fe4S-binding SPASM domain
MSSPDFSLILLPTLKCNADCEYCFEIKTSDVLTLDALSIIISRILDYLEENHMETLAVYWQGGEVMTLPPQWFEKAHEIIRKAAEAKKKNILHYIQSNLLAYNKKWNPILSEMFGSRLGSSFDFPNLYRKIKRGSPEEYDRIWKQKFLEVRESGIEMGVISIPNAQTLEMGAERFYSYFVEKLGIMEFQINTPFPGGQFKDVKTGFHPQNDRFSRFLTDLAAIWIEHGYDRGVKIDPLNALIEYFTRGNATLPCIWQDNCVNDFVCIDPRGYVSQCDCWVTSYPEYRFGNIFEWDSLSRLLQQSKARKRFQSRPGVLIQQENCIRCDYLALCHGGCPIRTCTVYGDIFRKDPYCELYQSLFRCMEEMAVTRAQRKGKFFGCN